MDWASLDWNILERLREGFISGRAAEGPYWQSTNDLTHYDFTYAERIGWKWDHVLSELRQRGWRPPQGKLLDWGCGSGVAHRRMAEALPSSVTGVRVFDHSTLAESFSIERRRVMRMLGAQVWVHPQHVLRQPWLNRAVLTDRALW